MKVLMPTGEKMYLNTIKITLKPGYSFGVHVHPFGGMACVSGGQFRLFFEYPFSDGKYEGTGPEGALRKGGQCYYFPVSANRKPLLSFILAPWASLDSTPQLQRIVLTPFDLCRPCSPT